MEGYVLGWNEDPIGDAAIILGVLLFPDERHPLDSRRFQELYHYIARLKTENDPEWAEGLQRLRPGYALLPNKPTSYWERKYAQRLEKALWAGFVGEALLDPPKDAPAPGVNQITEAFGSLVGIDQSNFSTRVWRRAGPAIAACVAFKHIHAIMFETNTQRALPLWLTDKPENGRRFVALAMMIEPRVIAHAKIPVTDATCIRLRLGEVGS